MGTAAGARLGANITGGIRLSALKPAMGRWVGRKGRGRRKRSHLKAGDSKAVKKPAVTAAVVTAAPTAAYSVAASNPWAPDSSLGPMGELFKALVVANTW